jgi:hypothetical protein
MDGSRVALVVASDQYDDPGLHRLVTDAPPASSVFTGAVVDGLTGGEADRDGDGWVGLTELVGYVADKLHRVTPNPVRLTVPGTDSEPPPLPPEPEPEPEPQPPPQPEPPHTEPPDTEPPHTESSVVVRPVPPPAPG